MQVVNDSQPYSDATAKQRAGTEHCGRGSQGVDSEGIDDQGINGEEIDDEGTDVSSLVEQAQKANADAMLKLLHRFAPLLTKWQKRLAQRIPGEEKEVLQDEVCFAFLMLIIEFEPKRGVPFEGYIHRMLACRLRDQIESECRCVTITFTDVARFTASETDEIADWLQSSGFPVMHSLNQETSYPLPEQCWCQIWWEGAIALLAPRQQQVMQLVFKGHTEREIAEMIGIHRTTVYETKKAARKNLQKIWFADPCNTPQESI
jgi:RNA polymerase sigma factor (sigma-70 family)